MTTKILLGKSTNSNTEFVSVVFYRLTCPPSSIFLPFFLHKTLMPREQVVIQAMLIRKTRMHATAPQGMTYCIMFIIL
jgi:hypothetical protein